MGAGQDDIRLLFHDDVLLVGERPQSLDELATLFVADTGQRLLLRGPPVVGKSAALRELPNAVYIDPAILVPGAEELYIIDKIGEGRSVGGKIATIVLDGLERARLDVLEDLGWLQRLADMGHAENLVVVARANVPRPFHATLDVLAARSVDVDIASMVRNQVGRTLADTGLRASDARRFRLLLGRLALLMQELKYGCGLPASLTGSRMPATTTTRELERFTDRAIKARILSVTRAADDQRHFVFRSTSAREFFAGEELMRLAVDNELPVSISYEAHEYFAEQQELAPVVHHITWSASVQHAVAAAGSWGEVFVRSLADRNPYLAAAALSWLRPDTGLSEIAELVSSRLPIGSNREKGIAARATEQIAHYTVATAVGSRAQGVYTTHGLPHSDLTRRAEDERRGISRTPVSNGEYARFVAAGGYGDCRYWDEEGWAWRTGAGAGRNLIEHWVGYLQYLRSEGLDLLRERRGWRPERYQLLKYLCSLDPASVVAAVDRMMERRRDEQAYALDARFNGASKPVVGVNLYEAEAFCRWQTIASGCRVRLPTAREWDASYSDGATFPWGSDFDPGAANTLEAGLGSTTPIGMYPSGFGGNFDMCGNVWEWTTSKLEPGSRLVPPGKVFAAVVYQVVKGGSWDNQKEYAMRNSFDLDPPEIFGTRLGFRPYYV